MMNNSIPKVKTAHVLLVNVDDRHAAMLRMAFKMYNSVNYHLIQPEEDIQPELVLVDGDAEEGEATWQKTKDSYPNAVVVFFAHQVPSITAPFLRKPIKFETLFQNLRNLKQGNGIWLADEKADDQSGVTESNKPDSNDEQKESNNSGHSVTIERFYLKHTLLGLVRTLSQQKDDTAILHEGKPILIVFPEIAKVLLVVESDALQKLCRLDNVEWQTRVVPSTTSAQLQAKAKLKLQSFIWQLSIWTSRNRLIDPISANTIVKLKAWPNLTRLAYLPEAIRLSAFLARSPVALNMLYKLLPVSLDDVVNYIAATYSIGALEIEQPLTHSAIQQEQEIILTKEVSPSASSTVENDETAEDTENVVREPKGLLARLMGRLRSKNT